MGQSSSRILPSDPVNWRTEVFDTAANDVSAVSVEKFGIVYVCLRGQGRAFFLLRPHSPLSFFIHHQRGLQQKQEALLNSFSEAVAYFFRKSLDNKVTLDPFQNTRFLHGLTGLRLTKAQLLAEQGQRMTEIKPFLVTWALHHADITLAVSNWISMAETHTYGDMRAYAERWLKGERNIEQETPTTEIEKELMHTQQRMKKSCIFTLREFICEGAEHTVSLLEMQTAVGAFIDGCQLTEEHATGELPPPETIDESQKDESKENDEIEEEEEEEEEEEISPLLHPIDAESDGDQIIVLRVSRRLYERLIQVLHK